MNVIRKGVEADQKKAVQYEIKGKSAVKYIKKKKLEQELAAKVATFFVFVFVLLPYLIF